MIRRRMKGAAGDKKYANSRAGRRWRLRVRTKSTKHCYGVFATEIPHINIEQPVVSIGHFQRICA